MSTVLKEKKSKKIKKEDKRKAYTQIFHPWFKEEKIHKIINRFIKKSNVLNSHHEI